jgi:oxygen-independent coproporphyrinogen III oxidase
MRVLIEINVRSRPRGDCMAMFDGIHGGCALKPDCPRGDRSWATRLIEKYDGRVPRYTSYPTAVQFTPEIGAGHYRDWLSRINAAEPVSLYVHIPFCDRLCWYCGCHTGVAHKRAPIADYVETLKKEIALTAGAIPHRPRVGSLHLGGGSPNTLSPADLDALFACLRERFALEPQTVIAAEIDPRSLTPEWIKAVAGLGLNRASLGVQDLDPAVQAAINRHQPFDKVEWAVKALRQAGIASINLDLVFGLPRQTTRGILNTIDQILDLEPDRLALFGYAHVPWMMARQKLIKESELPNPLERYEQQLAADKLEDAGYVRIGFDHFALPADALAVAAREGRLRRNFQGYTSDPAGPLLGFGASSIGTFDQGFVQNTPDVPQWRAKIEAGEFPAVRGIGVTHEDRFWGDIIHRLMCDLKVDLASACRKWAVCPAWLDPELVRLRMMERDGLVKVRNSLVTVTALGRPFLRTIASVFDQYLPEQGSAPRHSRMI